LVLEPLQPLLQPRGLGVREGGGVRDDVQSILGHGGSVLGEGVMDSQCTDPSSACAIETMPPTSSSEFCLSGIPSHETTAEALTH
jgi:hypothetical protein